VAARSDVVATSSDRSQRVSRCHVEGGSSGPLAEGAKVPFVLPLARVSIVREATSGVSTASPCRGIVPASVLAIAETDAAISMCRQASRHTAAIASRSRASLSGVGMVYPAKGEI
jgi:hypothetical protein